jgi:hypothetical protein
MGEYMARALVVAIAFIGAGAFLAGGLAVWLLPKLWRLIAG